MGNVGALLEKASGNKHYPEREIIKDVAVVIIPAEEGEILEFTISDRMKRGEFVDKISSGCITLPECEIGSLVGIKYERNGGMFCIPIVSKTSPDTAMHYSQPINSANVLSAIIGDFQSLDFAGLPVDAMMIDKLLIEFQYGMCPINKHPL